MALAACGCGVAMVAPAAPAAAAAAPATAATDAPRAQADPPAAINWRVAAVASASHWQEYLEGGLRVRESGTLAGLGGAVEGAGIGGGRWRLWGRWLQGTRSYQGYSSVGQAVATHSRIDDATLGLRHLAPWLDGWQWGLGARWQSLRRRLADAPAAQGYVETFSLPAVELGLRRDIKPPGEVRLAAEMWLGADPWGRMRLQLPGADATSLRLGQGLGAAMALHADGRLGAGWRWQASAQAEWQRHAAGPAATVTRSGLPVGAATQPATTQTGLAIALAIVRGLD